MSIFTNINRQIKSFTGPTVAEFCEQNAADLWQGAHLIHTKRKIARFCAFKDHSTLKMAAIEASHLTAFNKSLSKDYGLKDGSINRYSAALSKLMNAAVVKKVLTEMPSVPWRDNGEGRVRYFTDEEQRALIAFFKKSKNPWMAHVVIFALQTGMRLGEIMGIGLDPDEVKHPFRSYGVLSPDEKYVDLYRCKNTSGGERERRVGISPAALEALYNLNMRPLDSYNMHTFYAEWARARHRIAPGDKTFVFHVCRHTCATYMANEMNMNQRLIAEWLGHRSEATTAKYVHSKPETITGMAAQLDQMHQRINPQRPPSLGVMFADI